LASVNIPDEPTPGYYHSGNAEITISNPCRDNAPLHLMVDSYSANRTGDVRNLAAGLWIELFAIPPEMTDQLQPLDGSVLCALKSIYRSLFDLYCADHTIAERAKLISMTTAK
jgi:hypothetical protein